jgi:hypothetical protein
MKTKIILIFLIISSLTIIVLGFIWSKSLSVEQELSKYFSDKENIYLFYRPSECSVSDLDWEINGVQIVPLIQRQLASEKWKSVLAQRNKSSEFTLIFEQNRSFQDSHVDQLCAELGLSFERKLLKIHARDRKWLIKDIGNYIVISNFSKFASQQSSISEILARRDRNASFACIIDGQLQEYYCFPHISKSFTNQRFENIRVNSMGAMDLGFYNVIPKTASYFEFLDKDILTELYPDWQTSPLLEYMEPGVIFSALNNVNFYLIPISELFSANEIIESISIGAEENNMAIKSLTRVIPGYQQIFATVLENSLVLCSSQAVLESIALSYQMQQGINTTKRFEQMMNHTAAKVHYRWYNRRVLLNPESVLRIPISSTFGYAYFRNRDKTMRFVNVEPKEEYGNETRENTTEVKVLWNYSLSNIQSTFHLNANPVVGIYNPSERNFSIIGGQGKVLNSVVLNENIKSIHPLEKGFLLETFEKLYWIPEENRALQREYNFKGQIQSTIATYTWNGEEFINFISDQKLHKLSLKNGKIDIINIPVPLTNQLPQLHAFNNKKKLCIGYFGDQSFHYLDISNNRWSKEAIQGEVLYSEKIDGKIQYVEKTKDKAYHKIVFGAEQQIFNPIRPSSVTLVRQNRESIWILRDGRDMFVYRPKTIKGTLVTINGVEISGFEPIFDGERLLGMLLLDDVKSEVHYFKRRGEDVELNSTQKFRGSKFIKLVGNKQFITFVDGQLVGYEF